MATRRALDWSPADGGCLQSAVTERRSGSASLPQLLSSRTGTGVSPDRSCLFLCFSAAVSYCMRGLASRWPEGARDMRSAQGGPQYRIRQEGWERDWKASPRDWETQKSPKRGDQHKTCLTRYASPSARPAPLHGIRVPVLAQHAPDERLNDRRLRSYRYRHE